MRAPGSERVTVDGRRWAVQRFNERLVCDSCGRRFHEPEPRLFSFSSPLGACPECRGFGSVPVISFDRLVPDPSKTLREGAIAAWTTPAYRHELDELLELADDYGIPVDVPFSELEPRHLQLIEQGVPERQFGGLRGFFRWLERHRYKLSVRVFLNRWRAYATCSACHGDRLGPDALAVRIGCTTPSARSPAIPKSRAAVGYTAKQPGFSSSRAAAGSARRPRLEASRAPVGLGGRNIAEVCRMTVSGAQAFLDEVGRRQFGAEEPVSAASVRPDTGRFNEESHPAAIILRELKSRVDYLAQSGLGYLTLDRPVRTISGGEARRVALTACLGSRLVNTLYVLDEPSAGLHPRDSERVIESVRRLRDAGNTVVVVEHEEPFLRAADELVDIGPGAGREGGRVVYQGPPGEIEATEESLTGQFLQGERKIGIPEANDRRKPSAARIRLEGARGHNLQSLSVEFPLGLLCVVTGVSGSGKSTLVEQTLYPALCRALKQPCSLREPGEFDRIAGTERIDEVVLVDPSPIGRTPRSNPVTYMKAFDEIRRVFAATPEARARNFTATHFSFNAARGGRCRKCKGNGSIEIDMQFLADVAMVCPECHGRRYRADVLEVKYRGRTIADVLEMTAREAFAFFRTQPKVQRRLNVLKQVGLEYLPLGQPATTLSGGESQRLKLASFLAAKPKPTTRCRTPAKRETEIRRLGSAAQTLFLINEPTTGLHPADIERLLECFGSLLAVGHSLIVIEHNLDVIKSADWVIDLGPEAGEAGGKLVACGPPEAIAGSGDSITGRYLRQAGIVPSV